MRWLVWGLVVFAMGCQGGGTRPIGATTAHREAAHDARRRVDANAIVAIGLAAFSIATLGAGIAFARDVPPAERALDDFRRTCEMNCAPGESLLATAVGGQRLRAGVTLTAGVATGITAIGFGIASAVRAP